MVLSALGGTLSRCAEALPDVAVLALAFAQHQARGAGLFRGSTTAV